MSLTYDMQDLGFAQGSSFAVFFHNVKLDEYTVNHCQLSVFILILQNSSQEKSARGLTCTS